MFGTENLATLPFVNTNDLASHTLALATLGFNESVLQV